MQSSDVRCSSPPPLPDEELPPLPSEEEPSAVGIPKSVAPVDLSANPNPEEPSDDWHAIYDPSSKQFYFHNTRTKETTWDNPRLGRESDGRETPETHASILPKSTEDTPLVFQARFDRVTGRFISDPNRSVENFTPEARADRQMSHYVDTSKIEDTGLSLKAERRKRQYSKKELSTFKLKQKEKRENKRRQWLLTD